ncbi:MAG: metallopeptidase family protein [Pseudorhodobacter sp.]
MTFPAEDALAPDLAMLDRLARGAVAALPEPWRAAATKVLLRIEEFPGEEILSAMDIDDPYMLTGLYEGVPLTEKSVSDQPGFPDTVWLFRRPILDEWLDRGNVSLAELVSHVVIHELAHHFGWSDEDIGAIDPWWE